MLESGATCPQGHLLWLNSVPPVTHLRTPPPASGCVHDLSLIYRHLWGQVVRAVLLSLPQVEKEHKALSVVVSQDGSSSEVPCASVQ